MFLVLAMLGCVGATNSKGDKGDMGGPGTEPTSVKVSRPVELPPGQAVTRSCFGFQGDKDMAKGRGGWNSQSPSMSPPPPPARALPTSKPKTSAPTSGALRPKPDAVAAAPAPAAPASGADGSGMGALGTSGGSASGLLGGVEGGSIGGSGMQGGGGANLGDVAASTASAGPSKSEAAPATSTPTPVAAAEPADNSPEAPLGNKGVSRAAEKEAEQAEAKKEEGRVDRRQAQQAREEAKPVEPQVDWGGVTWLSNDDSMSLASAQRVLFAVKDNVPFKTSEVRPHELLNYFSFNAAPVAEGQLFSVTGDAVQTAPDTLTLALTVQGAKPEHIPLDLTLVVDVSGSMQAEGRMEYVKRGLHKMSEQLQRGDRVNLVLFDHEVCTPLEDYVQGRDATSTLASAIDALEPRGSTDLNAGLKEGYRLANSNALADTGHDRNHRVMVLTDALLNTGDVDPNTVSEVAKAYETHGVRMTGVGVGREFNDKMLDMLTEKGKGAYVYLGSEAVVDRLMGVGFESLTRTIAHDVRFALDLPESLGLARFYGEESSSDPEDIQPIHYYAGTRQVFLQDLKIKDGKVVGADELKLTIHYQDPASGTARTFDWSQSVGQVLSADTHNVKKARALMAWSDFLLARSMNNSPCGAPLDEYRSRIQGLSDDAEIAYVNGLSGPLCGVDLGGPLSPIGSGVAWRVRVDSDVPIAEVELACKGTNKQVESLTGSDTVARFNATPGACVLTLQGPVPMTASVDVPSTGGEARCMVRGGKVSCS